MRVSMVPALLLAGGALLAGAVGAAPNSPGYAITCASPRTAREYREAADEYYLGKLEAALADFRAVVKREPECAMAHFGLSRALSRSGNAPEAAAEAARAQELAPSADDREQQVIAAWNRWAKALNRPENERKTPQGMVRTELDRVIALYPDDPEAWILRGDTAESPLRAAPFYLAALQVRPDHPFGKTWSPKPPPAPELKPTPTQPVAVLSSAPPFFEGLGQLSHRVTTSSPEAQRFYEQGLRLSHAYVMPGFVKNGAAVCFQHAANLDPECAMAYWGLSFCGTPAITQEDAANRALELALKKGTDKERRFTAARVLEVAGPSKREQFLDALDGAIAAYPDDVELWIWRGKVYGTYGQGPGNVQCMPYELAAVRMHPEHPAPNHELIHAYEGIDRPALGWPYTEGFRRAAPNMPHAHHMQAHLAMRLGRWQEAIDCTRTSRRKSLEGFPELDPSHHIDILVRALAHEGRFQEAEAEPKAYRNGLPWARLLRQKWDLDALDRWSEARRTGNAPDGFYVGAVNKLDRGELAAVVPLMARVEEQWKKVPSTSYRWEEVHGRYLVQTGSVDEGLKILRESGAKAVGDSALHAWGGGSYILENWGEAALRAHRWDEAEQAFLEALAHEHGSIIGALGMQVVSEQRARPDLAAHYRDRARAIWKDADAGALDRQLDRLRKLAAGTVASARS